MFVRQLYITLLCCYITMEHESIRCLWYMIHLTVSWFEHHGRDIYVCEILMFVFPTCLNGLFLSCVNRVNSKYKNKTKEKENVGKQKNIDESGSSTAVDHSLITRFKVCAQPLPLAKREKLHRHTE
jgi:hypothetical protein